MRKREKFNEFSHPEFSRIEEEREGRSSIGRGNWKYKSALNERIRRRKKLGFSVKALFSRRSHFPSSSFHEEEKKCLLKDRGNAFSSFLSLLFIFPRSDSKKAPRRHYFDRSWEGRGSMLFAFAKSRNGTGGNVESGIDSIYYFSPSIPLPHILGRERGTKTLFFLHTHIGQTWIHGERKEIRSLAHLHKETYRSLLWNAKAGQDFFKKRKCYLHVDSKKAGKRGKNTRFLCT